MFDPVFDVAFEGAKLREHHLVTSPDARRIAIVCDVYPEPEVQKKIPQICSAYVVDAGVELICLEGTEGRVPIPGPDEKVVDLERKYPGLSTGAHNLLLTRLAGVQFFGVESPEPQAIAQRAMIDLGNRHGALEKFVSALRPTLIAAQQNHYPAELAELRRTSLNLYGEDAPLGRRVELCDALIRLVNESPNEFPQVETMRVALSSEHGLDFDRIESERTNMVKHVMMQLGKVFKTGGAARKSSQYEALRRFAIDKFGITPDELQRNVELRGTKTVDAEFDRMLNSWLLKEALRFRKGRITHGRLYGEFVELAESLGTPANIVAPLRAYVDYVRLAQDDVVGVALLRQLQDVQDFLSYRIHKGRVRELFDLEEDLERLYLGMSAQLKPDLAQTIQFNEETLRDLLLRLVALAKPTHQSVGAKLYSWFSADRLPKTDELVPSLSSANAYYNANIQRSRRMAQKAVAAMTEAGVQRSIIVAGGFHAGTIARTVDDEGDLGWSVVTPEFELTKGGSPLAIPNRPTSHAEGK